MTGIVDRIGLTSSIRSKLIALFLLVSIIPIITVSYMAFEYGSASTEERVMAQLTSIADLKEIEIENWVEEQKIDIQVYSDNLELVNLINSHDKGTADLPKMKRDAAILLDNIDHRHNHYKRLTITNNSGAVIVTTDPEDVGDTLNDNYITYPISTKDVYIKDIFKTDEDEFSMILSAPIFSIDNEKDERSNEVIGVLIIEMDMAESLYPMIENWPGMEDTGETLLVRREGNEVVFINELRHLNESALYLRIPINSTDALPAIRSSGGEEGIMITEDYVGEKVLSAYRHIDLPNWGFVAKIDEKEAFAGIEQLKNRIAAFSVVMILLVFGMAISISTTITKPIIDLKELTKKVAQGDFSEYPKVTSKDEIGSLTYSFVKMETNLARSKRELEDYSENLQHKVDEKTSKLVESEERFKTMIDQAPLGIALIDSLTGHIHEVNPMFAKIVGRTEEEMSTIDWMQITHPDDIQENLDNMTLLNAGKINGFQMEKRYIHRDGSFVWINMTIAPMNVKDKSQPRHLCMIENITERKRIEEAFQESKRRLLRAQEVAHLGDWELDVETSTSIWSDELYRIYGFEPADNIALGTMIEGMHPDDRDYVNETLAGWIENGGGKPFEYRILRPDGSIRHVYSPAEVELDSVGKVVKIYGTVLDVTELKENEEKLQATSDYLNKLIDYTNAPFVVWNPEFKIERVNHAFEELTGYTADEIVNTELSMYFPEKSRQQSMDNVKRTLKGEYWKSVEMSILQKDGNVVYMVWNSANLYEKDGKTVTATIAQGIDISERKNLMDKIKQMNINLEQKVEDRTSELTAVNKELEAFSYSVSHDLRAPLRSIDGFSQALLEDYGDKFDETGTDYLNRVRNATLDMGNLIDDLLNLSRITRGEMKYSEVDLSMLVSDIAKRYKAEDPNRQINYVIDEGVKANGDERLLRAMLENLMSNAYKFSSQEPIAKIKFGVTNINDENAYYVCDNGVGFDMKYSDKLFGAFQRLHSKTEFPGTGIGLATVQRVIHKHGGHVWAESELGKGATFYFTL